MSKWILGLVAVAALVAFILWQRSGTKTSYVNGLPEYSALPNRQFLVERDCYIFKFKDRNTDWPLVADHALVPALPAEVDAKNIGADLPEVRILDVVRSGARIKLVSVRRDESPRGTTITFETLFYDERERNYPRLDVTLLLDHSPEKDGHPPRFLDAYVVPREMK